MAPLYNIIEFTDDYKTYRFGDLPLFLSVTFGMLILIFPNFATSIFIPEAIIINDKIVVLSFILNFFVLILIDLLENCFFLLDLKIQKLRVIWVGGKKLRENVLSVDLP